MNTQMEKMITILLNRTPAVFGLDIGTTSVKVVEFSGDIDNLKLTNYAIEKIPRDYVVDGSIVNTDGVVEVIKKCIKRAGIKTKDVVVSIPSASAVVKKINTPIFDNDDEMAFYVREEIKEHIPFAIEDVNIDYQVVAVSDSEIKECEVIVTVAKKEKIDERVILAQEAGLNPVAVDVEDYSLRNALYLLDSDVFDKNIMLINFSSNNSKLLVFKHGELIYSRDIMVGGDQLTQLIIGNYEYNWEQAESLKIKGDLPDDYLANVLSPYLENVALEFNRAVQFALTATNLANVENIYITGAAASIDGLAGYLGDNMDVSSEVSVTNPFECVSKGNGINIGKVDYDQVSLLMVSGLALRKVLNTK